MFIMSASDNTKYELTVPGVPAELKEPVREALEQLAPIVVDALRRQRREELRKVAEVLAPRVAIRRVNLKEANMRRAALEGLLTGDEWLTAADIGRLGGYSESNPAAPANRWKKERKIFAIRHQGKDWFASYQLDGEYRPLAVISELLSLLGLRYDGWQIAAWFDSTNAFLKGKKPKELLAEPARVVAAARRKHPADHG